MIGVLGYGIGTPTFPSRRIRNKVLMREAVVGIKVRWTNPDDEQDTGEYEIVRIHSELGYILNPYTLVTLLNQDGKRSEVLAAEIH